MKQYPLHRQDAIMSIEHIAYLAKNKISIWNNGCIKPLNIIRTLIFNSSKEGDIILDPFMGSGTTAVACIREKRHWIGYELNPEYYKIATRRIDFERRQTSLF